MATSPLCSELEQNILTRKGIIVVSNQILTTLFTTLPTEYKVTAPPLSLYIGVLSSTSARTVMELRSIPPIALSFNSCCMPQVYEPQVRDWTQSPHGLVHCREKRCRIWCNTFLRSKRACSAQSCVSSIRSLKRKFVGLVTSKIKQQLGTRRLHPLVLSIR
jgi:hypothetical protein